MKKNKSVYTPPAKGDDEQPNWLDTVGAPWMEVKDNKESK